jgi:hypothetical protein
MKGISRIESERCTGWLVRVYHNRKTIAKLFSDHKLGGKRKALQLAREHHAALLKRYPPAPRAGISAPAFHRTVMRHNSTGVTGVYRSFARSAKAQYAFFGVSFKLDGRHQTRKFYLHHFRDEAEALRHAIAFRRAMERAMTLEYRNKRA